jgi:ribosome-associated protein
VGSKPSRAIAPLRKAPRPPGFAAPSPLAGPKRAVPRKTVPSEPPEPSAEARSLALGIAEAGMDKKAVGIEILDVTGRVDYADFLVVMTGRSDRHVHAIATGIEEALARRKVAPLSVEGLQVATWVLLDFGDVVVHVFQEDARRLYDIEGLWIDAGRLPVPAGTGAPAGPDEPDPTSPLGFR